LHELLLGTELRRIRERRVKSIDGRAQNVGNTILLVASRLGEARVEDRSDGKFRFLWDPVFLFQYGDAHGKIS